jgi:hypothetical protein
MKPVALRFKLQLAWKHYGPMTCSIMALALIEIVTIVILFENAQRELVDLRKTFATANTELNAKRYNSSGKSSINIDLERFEDILKSNKDVPTIMTENWLAVDENHITTSAIEYRFEPDLKGGFTRLHIVVPVIGTYPAIKHYAFAQLRANPAMSLIKLTINRERVNIKDISAELHFVLFLRESIR